MRILGDTASGNCLKVKYAADHLGLSYTWTDIDIMKGESRTPEFLALNPMGQVPVIVLDDGRALGQSNAILQYLAEGTDLLPADAFDRAKVAEWLFWEQYSHEPYIAVCRFHMHYKGEPKETREAWRVHRGEAALDAMDRALTGRDFLVGPNLTIADIALLAYTRLAEEGGFDLASRPAVGNWIGRCEAVLKLD
ncbi:glutathione S-transferase family protein [Thalassobaculum sp.]|uniref:glutathione S-transferase family protein n=1 Tax=Thalassobaculum sp. TaxID=2022740 RepID=UPI003B5C5CF2